MELFSYVSKQLVVDALKDVVGIPSVSLKERDLAEYLCRRLQNAGASARVDASGNMIASVKFQKPGKKLYFNSHMDTVEVGTLWQRNPYGEVVGDRFYGVGACDCQASLTAMMLALEIIAKSGIELSGEVGLTAVAREQYPCVETKGTVNLIEDGFSANYCIVGEPTDLSICRGCEGMVEIIIEVTGVPCHAARPENGINAIDLMYEVMTEIKKIPVAESPVFERGALNFGVIQGGYRSCVLPEQCTLRVSNFVVENQRGEELLARIEEILARVRAKDERITAKATLSYDTRAAVVPEASPIIGIVRKAVRKALDREAELSVMRAHMDADFLINMAHIPTVAFGPGKKEGNVAGAEWVGISDTESAVKVYLAAVLEALGGQSPAE